MTPSVHAIHRPLSIAHCPGVFLVLVLALASVASAAPWVDAYGPSPPLHSLGFSGIVAGVDQTGRLNTLLWPNSGGYNQVLPANADKSLPYGCQWGVDDGQDTQWLALPAWKTEKAGPPSPDSASIEIVSFSATLNTTATQTFITSPRNAVIAVRIQLDTSEPARKISWFQQFAPVPFDRLPLALPMALPLASRGFVSFFDPQRARLYQFRPAHAGSQDWDRARLLRKGRATSAEWSSFQDGAWSATAFATREITCEFRDGKARARAKRSVVGNTAVVLSINPASMAASNRAEVFVAFGKNRAEVDQELDAALKMGFDALQSETQAEYAALLSPSMPHIDVAPDACERAQRDLRVLFAALDPGSGVAVAAPTHQPPVSAAWPELAAWTSLAWQLSGYPERARQQLLFFKAPLHATEDALHSPAAFPELFRTDAASALPAFVKNPASAGWIVLAVAQLLHHIPAQSAQADAALYYKELVLPAMHYLRRWSLPVSGGPPPGFDPVLFRDVGSVSNELLYYLAVLDAQEVAVLAGQNPESVWQPWQRELETLLRFRMVNESAGWDLSPTLAAWAAMTLASGNPLFKATVRTSVNTAPLGECVIPSLSQDPALLFPDTFESAVDLVALLQPLTP